MRSVLVALALLASAPAWAGKPQHAPAAASLRPDRGGPSLLRAGACGSDTADSARLCRTRAAGMLRVAVAQCTSYLGRGRSASP